MRSFFAKRHWETGKARKSRDAKSEDQPLRFCLSVTRAKHTEDREHRDTVEQEIKASPFFRMQKMWKKGDFLMKKSTKAILAVVIVAVLAVGAFLCWKFLMPKPVDGAKTVTVEITHADETKKTVELHTDAQYLWDAMDEEGLIDGTDGEYGKWVTTVDGEVADEANGNYWMFTKGGEWVETSCDTTPIADGESYEFFIYVS